MRLFSSPTSVDRAEPSMLAIVETLVATLAMASYIYFFDDLRPLLLSAILSPIVILGDNKTSAFALRSLQRIGFNKGQMETSLKAIPADKEEQLNLPFELRYHVKKPPTFRGRLVDAPEGIAMSNNIAMLKSLARASFRSGVINLIFYAPMFLSAFISLIVAPIVMFTFTTVMLAISGAYMIAVTFVVCYLARWFAIVTNLNRINKMLLVIPNNWFRTIFCTDATSEPEFFQGVSNPRATLGRYYRQRAMNFEFGSLSVFEMLSFAQFRVFRASGPVWAVFGFTVFFPVYVLVTGYRMFVKSSALVWLPLLWISIHVKGTRSIEAIRNLVSLSFMFRTSLVFSAVVFLAAWFKLALLMHWTDIPTILNNDSIFWSASYNLIDPLRLPLWQLLSLANAIITIGIWVLANESRVSTGVGKALEGAYPTLYLFRTLSSVYVSICNIYILYSTFSTISIPAFEIVVTPWW